MTDRKNKTKKLGWGSHLLAGVVGGGLFALLYLVLKIGPVWSIALGVLVYLFALGQVYSMMVGKRFKTQKTGDKKLDSTLEEGKRKLAEMRSYANKIRDYRVRKKVNEVHRAAADIFENFKEDPRDIKRARTFLNYYLDAAIKIIKKYVDLKDRKQEADSPELQTALDDAETLLDTVKTAFQKQLGKLLENDVMDLDTEIEVLKKALKMEGLE